MTAATSTTMRTESPALPDFDSVHRPSTSASGPSLYAGRKAALPLHFVIVGGGICGLSCAFALSHAGHKVTVLEKDETIEKGSFGLDIPPNIDKILRGWGFSEQIEHIPLAGVVTFMHTATGHLVGSTRWADEVIDAFGGVYDLIDYPDFYKILYDAVLRAGASVRLGATVTSVNPDTPSVTLQSGEVVKGDLIIGADGYHSLVREVVKEDLTEIEEQEEPGTEGTLMYSAVIPKDKLDPEICVLLKENHYVRSMGKDICVDIYPATASSNIAVRIAMRENTSRECFWAKKEDRPDIMSLQDALSDCEPRLQTLAQFDDMFLRTKYVEKPMEEDWIHSAGNVIIMGQAAHPMMPCTTEGTGLCIEDCVVLGTLFARLYAPFQIPLFLEAYEDIQKKRAAAMIQSEQFLQGARFVEPGTEGQIMRDTMMRRMSGMDDDAKGYDSEVAMVMQWEMVGQMFIFNATDAAEEWHMEWGVLHDRSEGAQQASCEDSNLANSASFLAIPSLQEAEVLSG